MSDANRRHRSASRSPARTAEGLSAQGGPEAVASRSSSTRQDDGQAGPGDPGQRPHHAGDHHAARLHLCRLQGRGAGAHARHRQHHPRPDRLRLLLLAHAAEPDPPAHAANDDNFMTYCFSTDMQEEEIIFGGEKKLRAAIQEAYDLFHPKAIAVFSTCPVGLIGDDVHAVARGDEGETGDQRLRLQLRGLQGREPVGRPPHRQQPVVQARDRPRRHGRRPASSAWACWASTTSAATPSCWRTCWSAAASRWWPPSAATPRSTGSRTPTPPT